MFFLPKKPDLKRDPPAKRKNWPKKRKKKN